VLLGADLGVLRHVFRLRVIPQNSAGHTIQPLVVAAHDDFIERDLACQNPDRNLFIGPALAFRLSQHRRGFHCSLYILDCVTARLVTHSQQNLFEARWRQFYATPAAKACPERKPKGGDRMQSTAQAVGESVRDQ